MKYQTLLRTLGVSSALLTLGSSAVRAELFSAAEAARNQAVASHPRAIEVVAELSRPSASPGAAVVLRAPSGTGKSLGLGSAWAASPRVIEEVERLSRTGSGGAKVSEGGEAIRPVWGVPLAANPRAMEENPALARGGVSAVPVVGRSFQVAPLK